MIDFNKFKTKAQDITLEPLRKKPKVSDEDLKKMFYKAEDNWYDVEDLKEIIGDAITVNTDDPKRTPINSRYLKRMHDLTGETWRQQTAIHEGHRYVRFCKVAKEK